MGKFPKYGISATTNWQHRIDHNKAAKSVPHFDMEDIRHLENFAQISLACTVLRKGSGVIVLMRLQLRQAVKQSARATAGRFLVSATRCESQVDAFTMRRCTVFPLGSTHLLEWHMPYERLRHSRITCRARTFQQLLAKDVVRNSFRTPLYVTLCITTVWYLHIRRES